MNTAKPPVDLDALLCALILVPRTYSRNRFYSLFESPAAMRVRRRAARVRGIIRQLTNCGIDRAEITGEQVLDDGRVLIRYSIHRLSLHRTAALSALEASALHYALHRAGLTPISARDERAVEESLAKLARELNAIG